MKLIKHSERKRFEFVCKYGEHYPAKKARFRWDPEVKRWWTDDAEKAAKLIEYADDEMRAELASIAAEKEASLEQSKAVDADIEIPAPDGLAYMPFQKAGIAYALKRDATLIGDEMGLGKTIQALGFVNTLPEAQHILIICPASLRINWKQEAEKWLVNENLSVQIVDTKNPPLPHANVFIINYDILKKNREFLMSREWDVMIVDECHYLKNNRAARTQAVLGDYKSEQKPIAAKQRLFLTGTPILNRPIEIQPVLGNIAPKKFGNFFSFAMRYCDAHKNQWGWDFSGASNLDELQEELRSTCMVRRLKADVLTELPAKRRAVIEIPLNGNSRVVNAELKAMTAGEARLAEFKAAVELAKVSEDKNVYEEAVNRLKKAAQAHFEEMSRLRKETAIAKAPLVAAHVADAVDQGAKVVVFAHHHEVIDTLVTELSEHGVVKLDGRDSMEDRNAAVTAFQEDDAVKVFVGGIKAAGVGLTLTESAHVVFAELDWVPGNMTQAEDRCHRIGQANSVLVQHLVLESSIDSNLAKTLVRKQAIIDKALDVEASHEPLIPSTDTREPISVRKAEIARTAEALTAEEIAEIHAKLKLLSAFCDGANALDGMGFNKVDTVIGKSLAASPKLTPKQAALGKKLVHKYRGQF